jgi:hypothetical protein
VILILGVYFYRFERAFLSKVPTDRRITFVVVNWLINITILIVLFIYTFRLYRTGTTLNLGVVYFSAWLLALLVVLTGVNLVARYSYLSRSVVNVHKAVEELRAELERLKEKAGSESEKKGDG